MYRDRDKIKKALRNFFLTMVDLANKDDKITDDEQAILDQIEKGIDNLEEQLIQVLESELEVEEFKDIQRQILQDIIHNTTEVAKEDGVITEEESVLLQRLQEFAKSGVL